jgi:nucleoside-diphosphate-sugar epimerase
MEANWNVERKETWVMKLMRVAVTGASGTIGQALIPRLLKDPRVDSVVAVVHDRELPADERCDVVQADVGSPDAVTVLSSAFKGCDAVVHLAWQTIATDDRARQQQINVGGTANVVEAAEAAGVNQLVHLSSAAVYSPASSGEPVTEGWPTDGVDSSAYSQDKVAVEAMLTAGTGSLRVGIVRPPMVVNPDTVPRVVGTMLGRLTPVLRLTGGRVPLVPVPAGIRAQVVHADDIAELVRLMLHRVSVGAFNVATDDVLGQVDVARLMGGIALPVPTFVLRPVLSTLHRAGLVPVDTSWLDLLASCPVLDTTRARDELGWSPRFDAMMTARASV